MLPPVETTGDIAPTGIVGVLEEVLYQLVPVRQHGRALLSELLSLTPMYPQNICQVVFSKCCSNLGDILMR